MQRVYNELFHAAQDDPAVAEVLVQEALVFLPDLFDGSLGSASLPGFKRSGRLSYPFLCIFQASLLIFIIFYQIKVEYFGVFLISYRSIIDPLIVLSSSILWAWFFASFCIFSVNPPPEYQAPPGFLFGCDLKNLRVTVYLED